MATAKVTAMTVGSVSQMHAASGSIIKAGESIGEIECMKTLFAIYAPCDGVLRWLVDIGAFVGQDEAIAEIET